MGKLDVDEQGIRTLAGRFAGEASRLIGRPSAPVIGPPAQATSAAVAGAYATLDATASALAARMDGTGSRLTVAAVRYASTDDASSRRLA